MQTTVSATEILLYIGYLLVIWESPRWLLTHGMYTQVEKMLRTAALARGLLSPQEITRRIESLKVNTARELAADKEAGLENQTVLDVWRVPRLLKISLILYFTWFAQVGHSISPAVLSLDSLSHDRSQCVSLSTSSRLQAFIGYVSVPLFLCH